MTSRALHSLLWAWDSTIPVPASGSGKYLLAHISVWGVFNALHLSI